MYKFDCTLIGRLHDLLGIQRTEIMELLDVRPGTFYRWETGEIPCERLVALCNKFRISLNHFIFVGSEQLQLESASGLVTPADKWKPMEWVPETAASLFGVGGITGISKLEASKRLNLSSYQAFDYWAKSPTALRVPKLIELLNEFQVDASLFFRDPNAPIPLPAWEVGNKHIAEIVADRMENYRKLERMYSEASREISSLRERLERANREIRSLRAMGSQSGTPVARKGVAMDSAVQYGNPFEKRGYMFHHELWKSLPGLFGMSVKDFCREVGLPASSFYSLKNIHIDILVRACNRFQISVSHFFLPKNEPAVVQDRAYYQISPKMFVPIENRIERMKFLFGKYSVADYSRSELRRISGIGQVGFEGMRDGRGGERSRVLTIVDVCTRFSIPPWLFFHDENRKKAVYAQSVNERLFLNAISIEEENERLRAKLKEKKG